MGVDWTKIRNEYINTDIGMRPLAEKYGVGANTLKSRATREKWAKARTKQCVQTAYKCVQKSAQAVATAEADRLSAAAASAPRRHSIWISAWTPCWKAAKRPMR